MPGADRQLRLAAQRRHPLGRHAELLGQFERARARGQLDHVALAVDRLKRGTAVLALDQARDVVVEDLVAQVRRDHVDQLLAVQDVRDVGVVEHRGTPGSPSAAPVMTTGSEMVAVRERLGALVDQRVAALDHAANIRPSSR